MGGAIWQWHSDQKQIGCMFVSPMCVIQTHSKAMFEQQGTALNR